MEQIYLIDVLKRNPKIDLVCPMFNNYEVTHWSIGNKKDSELIYLHKKFPNTRLAFDCYGRYVDLNTGLTMTKHCVIFPKHGKWEEYMTPFDGYLDKYVKDNQTNEMYKVKRNSTDHRTVVDKFDPTTFKPFDKILIWSVTDHQWCASLYSHYEPNNCIHYSIEGVMLDKFLPYNVSTQHLLGTDNKCEDFYKFWNNDK